MMHHKRHAVVAKFARLITNPETGLSQRTQFVDTEITGDAFLRLEAGPAHKPGPKPNRQRHPITLPKIGPKP